MATGVLPQFDAPFRIGADGQVVTVGQDSPEEIGAALYNLLSCVQGSKLNDPAFGVPSVIGSNLPVDTAGILAALRTFEPRASSLTARQAVTLLQAVQIDVTGDVPAALQPPDVALQDSLTNVSPPVITDP